MFKTYLLFILLFTAPFLGRTQVKNFSPSGEQITKFDNLGKAVDAHDGMIAYFNGVYYLYGTSYDCGFEWNNKKAPFCGFKSYSSKDLVNWKDEGFLFDAQNPVWQSRCDGKTYGCFRPHVVYNPKNNQYVLWINVYDNVIGYRVFTSESPVGPFIEVEEPKLTINKDQPVAGLNNGDHDLFVDDDGTAYLAITDWRAEGAIAIEQLTDDYLSGTGKVATKVTAGKTEAPGLFKRKGVYYITYSDPNCGYCAGTGTSYKTAKSPLGPWSEAKKISDNSCGGQPSFVATIKLPGDTLFLYGSDLWNNAAKNEALANFYWAPLTFEPNGAIKPLKCIRDFSVSREKKATDMDDIDSYKAVCEITHTETRQQPFIANRTGRLTNFEITLLKSGYPDANLIIDFYKKEETELLLGSIEIPADSLGWSAKKMTLHPGISVKKNDGYFFLLRTESKLGCFGYGKSLLSSKKLKAHDIQFHYTVE
ncbi:family 43 glycosylhydrolase [Olivibacter sp. CPCC 100613]|uniref:family 43 glycosylhydrolase n=1 Tax=Olivibacter sp. CPCC 100613 TaxID=3079931 RepID=UPI002FF6A184